MATQEIVTGSFSFSITTAQWVDCIPEIMVKFMFIQVTKIYSQPAQYFTPMGLCTLKSEFSSVLQETKSTFLKVERDGRFLIFVSNLFHSLMQ